VRRPADRYLPPLATVANDANRTSVEPHQALVQPHRHHFSDAAAAAIPPPVVQPQYPVTTAPPPPLPPAHGDCNHSRTGLQYSRFISLFARVSRLAL